MSVVMGDPKTVLEGSVKYRDKKKGIIPGRENDVMLEF